ncbi:MAG: hypothetical protein O7B26_03710 [Planctomycetota bacterium]|nr:hypothetical protein [Planctomycetota bacterium]
MNSRTPCLRFQDFRAAGFCAAAVWVGMLSLSCTEDALLRLLGGTPAGPTEPAVAVASPVLNIVLSPGAMAPIRWADIATEVGTSIKVVAQRRNATDEPIGAAIVLLEGRDALEDGAGDVFNWDITGVRVGEYDITVTISSPDGFEASDVSDGSFRVTTALPVPTLTFTAPGAADETFNPGDTFDITWTDNGSANADALVVMGLDLDFDHDEGDEIVLLRDQALSTDGDAGSFSFTGVDENGDAVPAESYVVFAIVDDGVNDPVTSEATGQLIVAP